MKRLHRKLLAAGLALVLTLALAACSGGQAEDILTKAQAAFDEVESMHYTIDMKMSFSAEGETMDMNSTAEADCICDPLAMDMDMVMDMMGMFQMNVKVYALQEGDSFTMYMGMDDGDGNITWTKQSMDDLGSLAQYDGASNMELYLKNFSDFKEVGTEDVNGVSAVRYDGVITQESLAEVMEASGVTEQYESLGVEGLDDMFAEMGDLPISIWLDPDTCLPVKYVMDMTAMMQNTMDKLMAQEPDADIGLTVDLCSLEMVCSDYNAIDPIEVPQEALDAPSVDETTQDLTEELELPVEEAEEAA